MVYINIWFILICYKTTIIIQNINKTKIYVNYNKTLY